MFSQIYIANEQSVTGGLMYSILWYSTENIGTNECSSRSMRGNEFVLWEISSLISFHLSFKQYVLCESCQLHQLMNLTVVTANRGLVWSSIVVLLQDLIGSLLVDGELVYVNYSSVPSLLLNDGEDVSVKVLLWILSISE